MLLAIIFLVSVAVSAVGFKKYVYFVSIGYGFSICAESIAMLILFRKQLECSTVAMNILLILYGLRLSGYLLYREFKMQSYTQHLKGAIKEESRLSVKIAVWIACAGLYVCQIVPVFYRMKNGNRADGFWLAGILLAFLGILLESMADWQKAKAKKTNPHRFVNTGLYRFVRCPNYLGELCFWTGVFVFGLNALHSVLAWILAVLGYVGIVYVMFSGARRLEIRQSKDYGTDPAYQHYVKTTPILLPFVPLYSVKNYKWLIA